MDLIVCCEPFAAGPSKASLLKLRPEILVGLDHVVENLLGNLHGRHGLVERERLERLLIRTLDARLDHELLGVELLHHEALLEQRDIVARNDLGAVLANVGGQLHHRVVRHVRDRAAVLANDQEASEGATLRAILSTNAGASAGVARDTR